MRLADGTLFPIPVTLPVAADAGLRVGTDIALRDSMNDLLAIMTIDELYPWDPTDLAERVLGTHDSKHPLVHEMARWGRLNASGPIRVLQIPRHYDFQELRRTPAQTREVLAQTGRQNVVAFQTRNPLHRVHEELTKRAIASVDGVLLLHPSVGMTKPGTSIITPGSAPTRRWRRTTTIQTASSCRCCRWRCAWPVPRKRSGTRSSGAITARTT